VSRIIIPAPIEIIVTYDEVANTVSYRFLRAGVPVEVPYPILVGVLAQVLGDATGRTVKGLAASQLAIPQPQAKGGA
jgi:hypothetical protein